MKKESFWLDLLVDSLAMRRTFGLLRGSSGLGWYKKYRETPEAFDMYTKCTPFDWTEGNVLRPKAFFEIQSGNEVLGNLEFELAEDIVPRTVKNFIDLVTGENPKKLTYQGTKFHYVRKNEVIMGGDVEHTGGRLSHAASQDRFFEDENFIIPHTARGLIRWVFFFCFFISSFFISSIVWQVSE